MLVLQKKDLKHYCILVWQLLLQEWLLLIPGYQLAQSFSSSRNIFLCTFIPKVGKQAKLRGSVSRKKIKNIA